MFYGHFCVSYYNRCRFPKNVTDSPHGIRISYIVILATAKMIIILTTSFFPHFNSSLFRLQNCKIKLRSTIYIYVIDLG